VKVWGDGSATRSFLYVEDFARGLLAVARDIRRPTRSTSGRRGDLGAQAGRADRAPGGTGAKLVFDPSKALRSAAAAAATSRRPRKATGFEARVGLKRAWPRRSPGTGGIASDEDRGSSYRFPGIVFAASVLLYFSFRSLFFNFDGVACAIAVEMGDFKHLLHGNHLV